MKNKYTVTIPTAIDEKIRIDIESKSEDDDTAKLLVEYVKDLEDIREKYITLKLTNAGDKDYFKICLFSLCFFTLFLFGICAYQKNIIEEYQKSTTVLESTK